MSRMLPRAADEGVLAEESDGVVNQSVKGAHHVEEGQVVLLDDQVSDLLPLLPCRVHPGRVVSASCPHNAHTSCRYYFGLVVAVS